MKTWKWEGIVVGQQKKDIERRKKEGKGDDAKTIVVKRRVYVVTIEDEDGRHARLEQSKPFDMVTDEPVTVLVNYGVQTKLDE